MLNKASYIFFLLVTHQLAFSAETVQFKCLNDFKEVGSKSKKSQEICFDLKMSFAISKNCIKNHECLALKGLNKKAKISEPPVLKKIGSLTANLCIESNGKPRYYAESGSVQIWSVCTYADNSFIDFDALAIGRNSFEE